MCYYSIRLLFNKQNCLNLSLSTINLEKKRDTQTCYLYFLFDLYCDILIVNYFGDGRHVVKVV